ncbi:helix-turn-helix transcriptional regulator [Lentzea sp. NBRC 105346]|uniref:helix-turn-helix domain-containing protein n=1 Tax=Lentzea sp. NBRC 105346 TaxID=3032205 RepID=UPI002554CEEA|nr:helix-turn-helix transcriptional regulator [Lentzea sp. NBRC 105346]
MSERWEEPAMRDALARRDMGVVFRLLTERGVTQQEIAAATRQNQSEISDIIGGRQVMAYDLLERIADGLGIPHGYLGLAYAEGRDPRTRDEGETAKRAQFLAHAAETVLGEPVFGKVGERDRGSEPTPIPLRVGAADVKILNRLLDDLTDLENQFGGGLVLPAVEGQLRWARGLLGATVRDAVRGTLFEAVALLHRRAASAAFDMRDLERARTHALAALQLAHESGAPALQAGLLYTAGRVEQYHGPPDVALRLFQLGYPLSSDQPRLRALLEVREARCYAAMSMRQEAQRSVAMAIEHFHAESEVPAWLRFFDESELYAAIGLTWAGLGEHDKAVAALRRSLRSRPADQVLNRAFDLSELAACHLRGGDHNEGMKVARQALELVAQLNSKRARDRLVPLQRAAERCGGQEIVDRVRELRA